MSAPKTAAQLAKKAKNIAAYEARCAALKQTCQMTKAERAAKAEAELLAQQAAAELQRKQEAEAAAIEAYRAAYIQQALNGPSKAIVIKWLAGRIPTFERLVKFFERSPNLTAPIVNLDVANAA